MAKIKSKIEEDAEGCFTSMIDIVFLLLIYFVVQPFKAPEQRMLSYLSQGGMGGAPSTPKESVTLGVAKGVSPGEVRFTVGTHSCDNGDMICTQLLQETGGDTAVRVVLMPTATVEFKHVMTALDQCAFAEMKDVKFAAP